MPKKRILAFGTFDLLHAGHKFFLQNAKGLGTELIVVVARNASVKEVKGKLPVHNEKQRLAAVAALPFVDKAILGKEISRRYDIIREIKPDVIALGYDQRPSDEKIAKELKKIGVKVKIVRLPAFNEHKFKSSKLRENKNL